MPRLNVKWFSIIFFFTINFLIWSRVLSFSYNENLEVTFLDVGQGDAIFIEAPNGNQLLIDGGPNDKVLRELSRIMPFFDRHIDVILATHPDSDHIGGLISVLERYDNDFYFESGSKSDTLIYKSLEKTLDEEGSKRITARSGMIVDLGNGATLQMLFPDRNASNMEPNTASIVSRLGYGDTHFLLTGDAPESIERYLVSVFGKNLSSDVLKAGHHGSDTSNSETFLGFASPIYSVISAGKNNRYGHPHTEVMERLNNFGIKILETAKIGNITFTSNGREVGLK